ncbi:hypothetical protein GE061_003154 [Apolygus lucorum]|uniref:MADF domain-containing protein n=1 Tax=Apolygus lucorum TaxID=248454 RepID=A0A6A4JC30_APOLU|nr:hypothetical protein GE061_003154 [Apolygus lucorum]
MSLKNFDKEKLISLVRAKRAIWDKSHPHHFNKGILHKHWQNISAELQCQENIVKRQWKYLRQEFGRQLKRAATAAIAAPEEEDITSWPHYYSMLFVIDQFSSRNSEDMDESQAMTPNMLMPKMEALSSGESDDDQDYPKALLHVETASSAGSEVNLSAQPKRQELTFQPSPAHSAQPPASRMLSDSSAQTQSHSTEKPQKHLPIEYHRDDDVAFFDSILPHVKSLKMEKKFQFRMQVQKLLYDMMFPPPCTEDSTSKTSDGYLARIVPIDK